MKCLFSLFWANVIGALIGPMLSLQAKTFALGIRVCPLFMIFGIVLPKARISVWVIAMFIWSLLHNPRSWDLGHSGQIVHGNGCGFINDDVLVAVDGIGVIRRAKGRVVSGDIVEKKLNPLTNEAQAIVSSPFISSSWICHYAGTLRAALLGRLSLWTQGRREWLQSFVLGADMRLDAVTTNALRRLGLLHIVVLSGSHIAVLSFVLLFSLRFFLYALYGLRILTMQVWPVVWTLTAVVCGTIIMVFAYTVGAPQSVQRAMLLCLVIQTADLFWIRRSVGEVLLAVWVVQAIVFPVHVLSLSMFLSWAGSLILSGILKSHFRKTWTQIIAEKVLIQCLFALLSIIVFGVLGLASVGANIFFGPIFSLLLPANILILFGWPESQLALYLVEFQMQVLQWVRVVDVWQQDHPWMMIRLAQKDHVILKASQILFLGVLIFRVYKRTEDRRQDSH